MGIKKRVASVGAALVLSSAGIITATAMAPEAQAGTCWYSQNTRATYNDVCRIGSRHYITTFQSGYYLHPVRINGIQLRGVPILGVLCR